METPVAPISLQMRRGKRPKLSTATPPDMPDFYSAVDLLRKDSNLPSHLRVVIGHLLEIQDQFSTVVAQNQELVEENRALQQRRDELLKENASLQSEIDKLRSEFVSKNNLSPQSSVSFSPMSFEEVERKRSVVISGIPESFAPIASSRVIHDIAHLRQLFDFLQIDCQPFCLYRMGRISGRPRLLKVVLPSSFYASLIIRRAPRLKNFPIRGIYVRPSLSKSERERLKSERSATTKSPPIVRNASSQLVVSHQILASSSQATPVPISSSQHENV